MTDTIEQHTLTYRAIIDPPAGELVMGPDDRIWRVVGTEHPGDDTSRVTFEELDETEVADVMRRVVAGG